MNANESDRAIGERPSQRLHVNRSQSSNDVIPSAIHIAAAVEVRRELLPALELLRAALENRSAAFWDVMKIGRTHLQDATPMRLGQEFSGYAQQVRSSGERLTAALEGIYELPLGGTAVGTGVNAPPGFAEKTIALIAKRTGLPFREAPNHFEAQAAKDAVSFLSGALHEPAAVAPDQNCRMTFDGSDRARAGGLGENSLAGVCAARLEHHARRQGEPDHAGKPSHDLRAGHRPRCGHHLGLRFG